MVNILDEIKRVEEERARRKAGRAEDIRAIQRHLMSKRWHDVIFPFIHISLLLAPFFVRRYFGLSYFTRAIICILFILLIASLYLHYRKVPQWRSQAKAQSDSIPARQQHHSEYNRLKRQSQEAEAELEKLRAMVAEQKSVDENTAFLRDQITDISSQILNLQREQTALQREKRNSQEKQAELGNQTVIQNITYNIQDSSIVADEFGRVTGGNDEMDPDNKDVRPPIMDENSDKRVSVNSGEGHSSGTLPSETSNLTGESTTKSCPICMRFVSIKSTVCDCGFMFDE